MVMGIQNKGLVTMRITNNDFSCIKKGVSLVIFDHYISQYRQDGVVKQLDDAKLNVPIHTCVIGQNSDAMKKFGIRMLPTTILFHKGREVDRVETMLNVEKLRHEIFECRGREWQWKKMASPLVRCPSG